MITVGIQPIPMSLEHDVGPDPSLSDTRRPSPFRLRDGAGRALGVAACATLTAWAVHFEHLNDPALLPLFLFFAGLSLLSVVLPASGPRGQRVGLIPAVGLAALLLLPPAVALLPLLLANTAYAFSRDLPALRRSVYERGLWLAVATVAGGLLHSVLHGPRAWNAPHSPVELVLVPLCYGGVYAGGRLLGLGRHFHAGRTVRRHAWKGWRLEAATLAVSAPVSVLMACAYPALGVSGVAGAAALLALLLVVAHFGFEVALLRDQVRAMEKISAVTVAQTSPNKVIERFLQLSAELVSCDRAWFWLTDESETRLNRLAPTPARPGLPAEEQASVRFGEGLVGRVADRKTALLVRDGARDPRLTPEEQSRRAPSFSMLLLPLVAGDETVGVVQFERDAPGTFTNRDLARVRALASQAAATVANVRSHQDVYIQAVTDGLTGLYNRRHMQAALLDERRRAHRYGHPLSVIMLDVDGFKTYNDTYGHVQGDVLLEDAVRPAARERPRRGRPGPLRRRGVHHRDARDARRRGLPDRRASAPGRRPHGLPRLRRRPGPGRLQDHQPGRGDLPGRHRRHPGPGDTGRPGPVPRQARRQEPDGDGGRGALNALSWVQLCVRRV